MNNINRVLVKSQAKAIIREKVFALFVISMIAAVLTNGIYVWLNVTNTYNDYKNNGYSFYDDGNYFDDDLDDYSDYYDYFDQFSDEGNYDGSYNNSSDNPIENFGNTTPQSYTPDSQSADLDFNNRIYYRFPILSIAGVIFCPLYVTLMGLYVLLIKKNPDEEFKLGAELGGLFKKSFNSSYLKKLIIYVLKNLFTFLLCLLFIIPGIVYSYSTYFAFQLMNDYPNLKPTEALKLSKKIVKGNRSELFWLDMSFIPWYLLCAVTFGIASIYVMPYYLTTQALYYENFRLRALAQGRVCEDDFLSADELAKKYSAENQQNYYAQPNNTGWGNNTYYDPQGANQNNYNPGDSGRRDYYYTPGQAENNTPPQQDQPDHYSYADPDAGKKESSNTGEYKTSDSFNSTDSDSNPND